MRFPGEDTVVTRGMQERKSLTIEANAKAFRTLIDTLYSDKIQSPIRELMSNAYDSHIAAGKADIPFEVHLPSKFNPTFHVKDYGVGMSHDFVMNLFSTLYHSTKDGSREEDVAVVDPDKQTGTLGLGSKSFFGYTDSATLTCTDGEEKRIYSLHMASGRVPDIALMARMPCKEPTSVQMAFGVREGDYDRFYKAFQQVMLGYPIIPNISPSYRMEEFYDGWEKNTIEQVTPAVQRYSNSGAFGFGAGIRIRQGSVTYPLSNKVQNHTDVLACLHLMSLTKVNTSLHVIDFPLGSVSFVPSREHLEDTDENIQRIVDQLNIAANSVKEELVKQINDLPTIQHKLFYCKDRFSDFKKVCEILGLNNVLKYNEYVFNFEESAKLKTSSDSYYSRRGHRESEHQEFKNRITAGKTVCFRYENGTKLLRPRNWWKNPLIFINDVYDKCGTALWDHYIQAHKQLEKDLEEQIFEEDKDEFFEDWTPFKNTILHYRERVPFHSRMEPLIFFNTTREALQRLFPAAKIYYISEFERKKLTPTRKIFVGEDHLGQQCTELDCTGKILIHRIRSARTKEYDYYLREYGRHELPNKNGIPIRDHTLIRNFRNMGLPYIIAYGASITKVKNIDKRLTLDDYLTARLSRVTTIEAMEYVQRENHNRFNLEGVDLERIYNMRKYVPERLFEKICPPGIYIKVLEEKRLKTIFGNLHELASSLGRDAYVHHQIDEKVMSLGYKLIPEECSKEYFRPTEIIFMRFLSTVYDIMVEMQGLSTVGMTKKMAMFKQNKKPPPETKYLKSIFTNLEVFLMEQKQRLERKYDAEL